MVLHSALITTDDPRPPENCSSAGVQLFQVFSSSSSLLGLSRSSDYAAVNGNLNALCSFRRMQGTNSQCNLWGEIKGTGLAGGGSGAAGRHGPDPMAAEQMAVEPPLKRIEAPSAPVGGDFPKEYYQREHAKADLVVAHKRMQNPIELSHKRSLSALESEGFVAIPNLNVSVKTKSADDKVLLICNLPSSTQDNHDGVAWTMKRGGYLVGPQYLSWTHDLERLENVFMPWLDEPGKARLDCEYTVNYRMKGSVHLSRRNETRELTAIVVPGAQVTSVRSHETMSVQMGRWHDVTGLQCISVTNKGEKVLVVCSIKYRALWADEMTRGRFTIVRDGVGLDPEKYGLQSVRALQKGVKRTMVMSLVDTPEPGPHLYAVRAAVTTGDDEPRVCQLDDDDRQLALIRLPGDIVFGPSRCSALAIIEEDKWTEIPGLSVTVAVPSAHDKVLIAYNTNFNPTGLSYEAYFTVFRVGPAGGAKNMGDEDQGMWSVASASTGSSEYPVSMFTDMPGVGTHTYIVHARTRRCESLLEPLPVEVGPDGQISAVLLQTGRLGASVVDQIAKEIDAAAEE
mmetsp:Transcript_71894/g.203013  ORF Transcript_71894/g.203013 Transcript_71894/m.203013 type:complete len:568 (+) Transcript_71894:84-1787(+)